MKRSRSAFDTDRLHGAGLPAGLPDELYRRLEARYGPTGDNTRQARQASQPPTRAPRAAARTLHVATLADIPSRFERIGSGFLRDAHAIWALRPAEGEKGGYSLVRLREETAVDFREASRRTAVKTPPTQPLRVGQRVAAPRHGQLMPAIVEALQGGGVDLRFEEEEQVEEAVPTELVFVILEGGDGDGDGHEGCGVCEGRAEEPTRLESERFEPEVEPSSKNAQVELSVGEHITIEGQEYEVTAVGEEIVRMKNLQTGSPEAFSKIRLKEMAGLGELETEATPESSGGGAFPPNVQFREEQRRKILQDMKRWLTAPPVEGEGPAIKWTARRMRRALKVAELDQGELEFLAQQASVTDGLRQAAKRFAVVLGQVLEAWQSDAAARQTVERAAARELGILAYIDLQGEASGLVDALGELAPAELQSLRKHLHASPVLREASTTLTEAATLTNRAASHEEDSDDDTSHPYESEPEGEDYPYWARERHKEELAEDKLSSK